MPTANEDLFDALLRHAVGLRRLSTGEVMAVLNILEQADKELAQKIRTANFAVKVESLTTKRTKSLLKDVRKLRRRAVLEMRNRTRQGMVNMAKAEQRFVRDLVAGAIPVQLDYASVSVEQLRSLVGLPFGGESGSFTLSQWFGKMEAADMDRIYGALQQGITQSETIDQIASRVVTATELTRRNAEAIVRTGVSYITNATRHEWYEANSDIINAERWTATLDGRTTAICRGRDGHHKPLSGTSTKGVPRPWLRPITATLPAHVGERSIFTAVLSPDGIAQKMPDRPFVRDTRTRRFRERDFRADARGAAGAKWRKMSAKQRNNAIRQQKQTWANRVVGQVPGDTTYDAWLRRQSTAFQNEVLGVRKAQAFRKGLKLDQFLDRRGSELTLDQLEAKFPDYVTVNN